MKRKNTIVGLKFILTMAGPGPAPGAFFSKLKAFGDRLENVAKDVAKDVATGVVTGVDKVTNVAKDIKGSILDSEIERLRSVSQFAKTQQPVKHKQFSRFELDEADKRADAILATFHLGYLEKDFDAVRFELQQLHDSTAQDEIDQIVDRLALGVETAGGKLSRHVMRKREQLIQGISTVATVEDDLKAALATTRSSRAGMRQAADEVQRHLRVAAQTRRKQSYMQLMEVVLKVKAAKDLHKSLRKAQEAGEYGEAILMCLQTFQGLESLKSLKVCTDLRGIVQRAFVDSLQRLDEALTMLCGEFDPMRYSKVLEGYMLQGVSGVVLADRVLQCFKESVHDSTLRVVRSLLLMQASVVSSLGSGNSAALEGSYGTLCAMLPPDSLRVCLRHVMEVVYDVLASYHLMALWHQQAVDQQRAQRAAEQTQGPQGGAEAPPAQQAQSGADFLEAVGAMLSQARGEVFEAGARRVSEVLGQPGIMSGEGGMAQVAELCSRFLAVGEAFCLREQRGLRDAFGNVLGAGFDALHRHCMEELSNLLASEPWKPVAVEAVYDMVRAVEESPLFTPGLSDPTQAKTFDQWMEVGANPFHPASLTATPTQPFTPRLGGGGGTHSRSLSLESAPASPSATAPDSPSHGSASGADSPLMLTASSKHMLDSLQMYARLLKPLGGTRTLFVWRAFTELFDRYLTAMFMLLSGVSMERLVLEDGIVTLRLRSTLLRILGVEGSRYKEDIEALLRVRAARTGANPPPLPAAAASATGFSWLDRFGDKMESLANDLDRSMTKTLARIGDKVPPGLAGMAGDSALMGGAGASLAAAPGMGLKERAVAAEAAAGVANTLRKARQPFVAALANAGAGVGAQAVGREVDSYFVRTVEAAVDLKDCLLQGSTRALLGRLLDSERGIPGAIAACAPIYGGSDPITRPQQWTAAVGAGVRQFADTLRTAGAGLPGYAVDAMWSSAVGLLADAMTEGVARVRRVTFEGRASMTLDLGAVREVLRAAMPPSSLPSLEQLRRTDMYIRAYYFPWDEFTKWCVTSFAQYGRAQLAPLVDLVADTNRVKRAQKAELLAMLDGLAQDYAA